MLHCRRRGGPQLPHQDSRCCPGEFTTTSLFGRKPPTKFDISVPVPPKLALEWYPLPWRTARESFVVARRATASNILSSLFFRLTCFVGPPSLCEKRGALLETQSRRLAVRTAVLGNVLFPTCAVVSAELPTHLVAPGCSAVSEHGALRADVRFESSSTTVHPVGWKPQRCRSAVASVAH